MVKVYAPASSANMSVGFDVLGAAVTPVDGTLLGDNVTVEAAEQFSLQNLGRFASKLPTAPQENIVYQCWESFCREIGKTVPVAMTLEKHADWLRAGFQRLLGGRCAGGHERVLRQAAERDAHAGADGRDGRAYLRQHSLRQRGAVLSWRHAVDDRREWDYQSAGARV